MKIELRCVGENAKLEVRTLKYVVKPLSSDRIPKDQCKPPPDFTHLTKCKDPFFPNVEGCEGKYFTFTL